MTDESEEARSLPRRLVPFVMLPLGLIACALSSAPWLRAYPSAVLSVPLFGAALLSVLLPVVVIGIGVRKLWVTALIDVVGFVFFAMLVALREPAGFADLWTGLVHGPSQILTFALPLVSPRTLLVAPVALCWLTGAVIGECVGRGWQSVVPYATMLVSFGLAYAATARAVTSAADGRRYDTILAGALLLTMLIMRVTQSWVDQDQSAESAQPEGILPMRGLVVGTGVAAVVAVVVSVGVQSSTFSGRADVLARTPPVDETRPLTPLSFIANLRPQNSQSPGQQLFTVTYDEPASRYISIGDVDTYNGDSWSFTRTFRPSGGVIPADSDPSLQPRSRPVTQLYSIDPGPMTEAPWMPFLNRPQRVAGLSVNIDPDTGMIVPTDRLRAGAKYSVVSLSAAKTLDQLGQRALPGASPQSVDLQLPVPVSTSLQPVLRSFEVETRTPDTSPITFLKALAADLRSNYALTGAPGIASSSSSSGPSSSLSSGPRTSPTSSDRSGGSSSPSKHSRKHPKKKRKSSTSPAGQNFLAPQLLAPRRPKSSSSPSPTPSPTPTPQPSSSDQTRTGGTNLASVLASILGKTRTATPEQYATLVALVARQLQVPARVVTGFRLPTTGGAETVDSGTYPVTSAEAWTWVEIPIQGRGWVVLDATPSKGSTVKASQTGGVRPTETSTNSPTSTNALQTQSPGSAPTGAPGRIDQSSSSVSSSDLVVIAVILLAALVVVLLLFLFGRKWLRVRRRKGPGDPRRRVLGAWQESIDVLVEAGMPDLSCLTSAEIVAATDEAFGTETAARARYLGDTANAAIFASGSWIGSAEADAAWQAQTELRRSVRSRLTLRQRVGADLRYHRARVGQSSAGPASWTSAARARSSPARSGKHTRPGGRRQH